MRVNLRAGVGALVGLALGCGPSVRITDDDGSGGSGIGASPGDGGAGAVGVGGGGGQGGQGGEPGPRSIYIGAGFGQSESVFVSDPSGAIKTTLAGADLPAEVEVVDGDLVSFFSIEESQYVIEVRYVLESYRVTPEVFAIEGDSPIPSGCGDPGPMQVTVTMPPIEGAVDYRVTTDTHALGTSMSPGDITFNVSSCDGDFDLFAYARGPDAMLAYQLIEGLPYTPGTSMSVPLSLEDSERRSVSIEVTALDGVEQLSGSSDWRADGMFAGHELVNDLSLDQPSAPLVYAPSIISPGDGYGAPFVDLIAQFGPSASGRCSRSGFFHRGQTDETQSFAPNRLALADASGDASWAFVTPGDAGDHLWQSWEFGDVFDSLWIVHEDPARPPLPAVMPLLPPEVGWPRETPSLYSIGNEDYFGPVGYAELLSGAVSQVGPGATEFRVSSVSACQ